MMTVRREKKNKKAPRVATGILIKPENHQLSAGGVLGVIASVIYRKALIRKRSLVD